MYKYETKFTKEETLRLHGELKNLGFEKNTTYIQTKLDHLKPDQRCTHKENIDDIFQGIAQICYKNQPKKKGQYNLNFIILQGYIYSQGGEHFLAVPSEFIDGKEQFLSGISDLNLTTLAKMLANTPQTLNVIICDYQMKISTTYNPSDKNVFSGQQPNNPGLSLIYNCRNNEKELSFYISQMLDEMIKVNSDTLDNLMQSLQKYFVQNQVIDPIKQLRDMKIDHIFKSDYRRSGLIDHSFFN